jgi:hypothetical protein
MWKHLQEKILLRFHVMLLPDRHGPTYPTAKKVPSATSQVVPKGSKSKDGDILSPDETWAAAAAALRAADKDHHANKAYRSSNRNMSPDRFRWSPTNVSEQDKDFEITDEALEEDHEIDLDALMM